MALFLADKTLARIATAEDITTRIIE